MDWPTICTPKSVYEPASSLGGSGSFWLCVEGQKGKGPGKSTVQIAVSLVTLPVSLSQEHTRFSTSGGIQLGFSVSAFTGSLLGEVGIEGEIASAFAVFHDSLHLQRLSLSEVQPCNLAHFSWVFFSIDFSIVFSSASLFSLLVYFILFFFFLTNLDHF